MAEEIFYLSDSVMLFFTTICFDFFLVTVRFFVLFVVVLFFRFFLRFLVVFVVVVVAVAAVVFITSHLLLTVN